MSINYKSVIIVRYECSLLILNCLSLKGGYVYVEPYVPEHTLGSANANAVQHNFSLGLGYKIKNFVLVFFYNAGFHEDRKVRNDILSGEYENFIHSFGLSIGKKF